MLRRAAAAAGLSLNAYCVRRLSVPGPALAGGEAAARVVARAGDVAGDALVGVVLYGSWARGTAGESSDVDVLVVVDRAFELTRALYRRWDVGDPPRWQDRIVDPHFVHLPEEGRATGVWGEAAVDGVMLFEADMRVSAALADVRLQIVEGRLVRRVLHGQPYWVAA